MPKTLSSHEISAFRDDACECAARLFAEGGAAGVTMRGLAAELGVSPMTPYRYFDSKEHLLQAVRERAFDRFADAMEAALVGIDDPIERFRQIAPAYVRFAISSPADYRIMFQLDQGEVPVVPELQGARAWAVLHGVLREAVLRGQLVGDPVELAHVSWFGVHGMVTLHLAGKLNMGRSIEEMIEPLTDFILAGATPPAASSRRAPFGELS